MIKRNDDGYYFVSDSGIRYDLFEGVTMYGNRQYTSDAIFIMLGDDRYFDQIPYHFVDYLMGATFFIDDMDEYDKDIASMVEKFEIKNDIYIEN